MTHFSYAAAFTRNVGWLTEWEQDALRGKRVAIAGLGGVGGGHLLTLTRLGIGGFSIADLDTFDLANFNRQVGANVDTIGRPKIEVMAEMALAINPDLRLRRFPQGVTPENIDSFLEGVNLFVDGFDFFELGIRRMVFRRSAELGIPAITAAPIGMGTNWLVFIPGGMTFERYFGFEGQPEQEQYLRFLMGVAPQGRHRRYMVDPSRVDLGRKVGPSTGMSCQLCAGVVGVEAVKLLLGRGNVQPAPVHHHFDPYLGTFQRTRLRWGMAGPLQQAKLAVARRFYLRQLARPGAVAPSPAGTSPLERILELARWAPSGDNAQPWRFEILGEDRIRIHFRADGAGNPYEYRQGEPSLLSLGMLVETIRLAASANGRGFDYTVEDAGPALVVTARLPPQPGLEPDPLEAFITTRSVHRRAMRTRKLTGREKTALAEALGPELSLRWFEGVRERWRIARLGARVTDVRLRAPELFPIHRRVIDWQNRHSASGLPAHALGLDKMTLRIMRWAMGSWARMHRLNALTGTALAGAQLDLWPGLRSAAFFSIGPASKGGASAPEATIRAGAAIQRFWLTATKLGLAIQPGAALIMLAHYGEVGEIFTADPALQRKTLDVARAFKDALGSVAGDHLFLGRIGQLPPLLPGARSVRHPISDLMLPAEQEAVSAAA